MIIFINLFKLLAAGCSFKDHQDECLVIAKRAVWRWRHREEGGTRRCGRVEKKARRFFFSCVPRPCLVPFLFSQNVLPHSPTEFRKETECQQSTISLAYWNLRNETKRVFRRLYLAIYKLLIFDTDITYECNLQIF